MRIPPPFRSARAAGFLCGLIPILCLGAPAVDVAPNSPGSPSNGATASASAITTPPPALSWPSETIDTWHGFKRHNFVIDGCPAWVVEPREARPGRPWSWCMEFPDAFTDRCAAPALLTQGLHHVYISVGNTFGSPAALRHLDAFYESLQLRGLGPKAILIGLSRGGLYAYRWAAQHPGRVAAIYGDAPVCDFKSWPGGKGKGPGSTADWSALFTCYGFKDEAEALAFPGNPIDLLPQLAQAAIPIIHVVGDADEVVPLAENTALVEARYRALGGEIQVIHKPGVGHHPHGLEDPTTVVQFLLAHLSRSSLAPAPTLTGNLRTHDPSTVVRCGDSFWYFYTGNGLRSKRSTNLLDWTEGPRVFPETPAWVPTTIPENHGHLWAPDIIQVNGRYLLYYSVSSWGSRDSAIGLATNPSLDPQDPKFRWTDAGVVFRSSASDNFNAIDPSVFLDLDGRLWLAFGSFWSGIKLLELDPATGLRINPDSPMHALASHPQTEAACLARHGEFYYLFVNWGLCCRGVDSTYSVQVGRSRNITGPYVDRDGTDMLAGGGSPFLASTNRFIGPGHAAILTRDDRTWVTYHFYDGDQSGRSTWTLRPLSWNPEGWPVAGEPASPSPPSPELSP